MLPKVTFVMIAWKSDYVLEPCLHAINPFGPVVVTHGPTKYWREKLEQLRHSSVTLEHYLGTFMDSDRTESILRQHVPAERIVWLEEALEKDELQAACQHLIPDDTDYVWLVDSDEIWKEETISKTLRLLQETGADSMAFKARSFYGGFNNWITGFERDFPVQRIQRWYPGAKWHSHRPPTVLAPDGRPWKEHKHIDQTETEKLGLEYFHYSYVFPSQMYMKSLYYGESESKGLSLPGYFEKIYVPWMKGDETARQAIEKEWHGVHNWYPRARTASYTQPFHGGHPRVMYEAWPKLKSRLETETRAFCWKE